VRIGLHFIQTIQQRLVDLQGQRIYGENQIIHYMMKLIKCDMLLMLHFPGHNCVPVDAGVYFIKVDI